MTQDEPYFMTNDDWFTISVEEGRYVLTEQAPPEAVESYRIFYKEINSDV